MRHVMGHWEITEKLARKRTLTLDWDKVHAELWQSMPILTQKLIQLYVDKIIVNDRGHFWLDVI